MQLLFPWEEAIAVLAETWASVLFPQHLEEKQNRTNEKHTREMLYYFIILTYCDLAPLCVQEELLPPSLSRAQCGCIRLTLCHFLSDHFRGICSYFLPASSPPPGLSLGCMPRQPCCVYLTAWSAGLPRLGTLGRRTHTHIASELAGAHVHTQEADNNSFVKKACETQSQTLGRVFLDSRQVTSKIFHQMWKKRIDFLGGATSLLSRFLLEDAFLIISRVQIKVYSEFVYVSWNSQYMTTS